MGKMSSALLIVFAIEVSLFIFSKPGDTSENTSLFQFLINPQSWTQLSFMSYITLAVVGIGAGTIIIGSLITGRDWVWRAGVAATFVTFGAVIFHLWIFLFAHLDSIFETGATEGPIRLGQILATLIVAPLLIYFITVIFDFISGKD